MIKYINLFFIFLSIANISFGHDTDIEKALSQIPYVIVQEIEPTEDFGPTYKLKVKQPLDHWDSSKGYFYQKVYLVHRGIDKPIVMNTAGYDRPVNSIYELTELLDANQINVEHRYFGDSKPDTLDYDYLNLRQITADLHRINQLLKRIYSGKWISMGISKGGVTTIFYRYFFPDDVDAAVPYVGPINREFEDQRIYTFLDTIGTDECREKIFNTQIRLFKEKDEILPLVKFFTIGGNHEFSYHSFEEAYELAILEYPFLFWQGGHDCNNIPNASSSIEELAEYFVDVDPIAMFSDRSIESSGPHYYQSAEEMGYYGYEIDNFVEYLEALPANKNPHAAFTPNKMAVEFDGSLLKEILSWTKNEGNNLIYIYGAIDTWSACAVQPSDKVNSEWFFLEGRHHYNARIRSMNETEVEEFINRLEDWLDIEIDRDRIVLLEDNRT